MCSSRPRVDEKHLAAVASRRAGLETTFQQRHVSPTSVAVTAGPEAGKEGVAAAKSPQGRSTTTKSRFFQGNNAFVVGGGGPPGAAEAGGVRRGRCGSDGDDDPPELTIGTAQKDGGGGGDRLMLRQDGVEGLDGLSPVATEDSPDWVRFTDWINNGVGQQGVSQGQGRRRSQSQTHSQTHSHSSGAASWTGGGGNRVDGGSVGAGRRLADVEQGFSPDSEGGGGRRGAWGSGGEKSSLGWCSDGSNWSSVPNAESGESDSAAADPRSLPEISSLTSSSSSSSARG